jgi:hypothetical protein
MMPDLEEPPEHVDYSRPAVNDALAPHDFVASEFDPDCGRCDRCGGGPGAEIHQKPVDQMARIADALEQFPEKWSENADVLDCGSAQFRLDIGRIAAAMEEVAGALHRIEDRFREITEDGSTEAYTKFMRERGL